MDSTKKTALVLNILSLSLLGLPLAACEGMDGEVPAPESAPTTSPAPASAEASFNVTSAVMGADGQVRETTVRMTESEWHKVMERRNAARAADESGPRGNSDVDRIQQGLTLYTGNCGSGDSEIFYQYDNFGGDRYCLQYMPGDGTYPWMDYSLPWSVHSYTINSRDVTALICTSSYDCNLYQCGSGSSVWYNAGTCPGHLNCKSQHIYQPPPQTYLSAYVVHLQLYLFPCQ